MKRTIDSIRFDAEIRRRVRARLEADPRPTVPGVECDAIWRDEETRLRAAATDGRR